MAVQSARSLLTLPTMNRADVSRSRVGEAGFTVVELSIVMAVIALASTLAVLSYRESLPTSRLRQATTELYSAIALAKVSAMSQNSTMTVQLSGASSAISGTDVTVTGTAIVPVRISISSSAGVVLMSQPLTTELEQVTVSPGAGVPVVPRVQFNSYGLHVGNNTQLITLRNTKGKIFSIIVSPSGKANWCLAATCS